MEPPCHPLLVDFSRSGELGGGGGGGGNAFDNDSDLLGNCGLGGAGRMEDERERAVWSSLRKMGDDESWDREGADPMRRTERELSGIVTSAARVNVTYGLEDMLEPCGSLRDIWIDLSERLITSGDEPKAALRSSSTTAKMTGKNEAPTYFAQVAYLHSKRLKLCSL